jgi:hypothetical protein
MLMGEEKHSLTNEGINYEKVIIARRHSISGCGFKPHCATP